MDWFALALFALTYVGLAAGRVPGLALDRTGLAVLGAVLFLVTGRLSLAEARDAVDAPTLIVLFGMMLLSVQYRLAGLYTALADWISRQEQPRRLLVGTIIVAAGLSAIVTNDVVCFALTPLIGFAVARTRHDPLPFLLAIACASNIGSALTPIGNPQNILIAQALHLEFLPFVAATVLPVTASLVMLHVLLVRRLRVLPAPLAVDEGVAMAHRVPLDRWQAAKALGLTALVLVLFLTSVPAWMTALAASGILLASRRLRPRDLLVQVDWRLLVLFVALFVLVRGFELSGWTLGAAGWLADRGADLSAPLVLVPLVALLSNLVSNVPAVMLLLPVLPAEPATGHALALASTLAGNAVLVGSIANLIVAEQARRIGLSFTFRSHVAVGLPVTVGSLVLAGLALALR